MRQAPELLCNTVFEHEYVVDHKRWIVMPVGVERRDRQAHFFRENPDCFIRFLGRWRRRRLRSLGENSRGKTDDYEKSQCVSEQEHGLQPFFRNQGF